MSDYESKQVAGWGFALAFGIVFVGSALALLYAEPGLREGVIAGLFLIGLLISNFAILTVRVTDTEVRWRFAKVFGRRVRLKDVNGAEVRRSPWFYGWGLRWTPQGWLWRSTGLDGVWLQLANGKQVGMGSSDPEALARAVRERL
ncbi:MAG: hypothetical protein AAF196_02370 [Planctomycetota bacterium]